MVRWLQWSGAMQILSLQMYTKSDLKQFKTYFDDLGIMDEDIMEQILNSLDLIAEIGYAHFNNKRKNYEAYD